MAARLGIFLGWIFTSVALALAALGAWLLSKHSAAPMIDGEFSFVIAIFVTGGIVWLLGRGVRFVLAGPKRNPNHIRDFVENCSTMCLARSSMSLVIFTSWIWSKYSAESRTS